MAQDVHLPVSLPMLAVIAAGALAGLVSAPHCALMCGPIGMHASRSRHGLVRYQGGRLLSYVTAGAVAGLVGNALLTFLWGSPIASALSWALALSLLLAAYRVWPRQMQEADPLVRLRRPGKMPLVTRLLRVLPRRPEVLGASSALLPCAVLWSGLAIAAASTSALSGAAAMLAFSITSGAGVSASGLIARRLSRWQVGAKAVAALLVVGAVLVALRPLGFERPAQASADAEMHCPLHAGGMQ